MYNPELPLALSVRFLYDNDIDAPFPFPKSKRRRPTSPQGEQTMKPSLNISEECIISALFQRRNNFYKFGKHLHNSFEIYHFLSGNCCMDVENKVLRCHTGDFVIIMPNVVHSFYLEQAEECTFNHIHFKPALFTKLSLDASCSEEDSLLSALLFRNNAYYRTEADAALAGLTASAIEQFSRETVLSHAFANLSLTGLLLHVLDMSGYSAAAAEYSAARKQYVLFAVDYIKKNYASKILISDIAGQLNITPRYLSRIFHEQMNMTILNYLNTYRINQAIDLMLNTTLSLTEVADRIGLKDSQHFSRLFSNTIGTTPNKYRKMVKKE